MHLSKLAYNIVQLRVVISLFGLIVGFTLTAQPTTGDATSIFASATWSSTNRTLVPNDGLFGEPLGARADETKLNIWSFTLGFRTEVHRNVAWEGALSYMRNGERYLFEDTDTSYMYTSQYSYIAVPFKFYYTCGDELKLLVGAGLVPQMFTGFTQNSVSENSKSIRVKEELKTNIGYSSFVISAVFNIGAQLKVGDRWSVLMLPEYKLQLNSSLGKKCYV